MNHIIEASKHFNITVITSRDSSIGLLNLVPSNVRLIELPFNRKIRALEDMICCFKIFYILICDRPDLIQSLGPKAGFLVMTLGFLTGIRVRIHFFTGQIWFNKRGLTRFMLKNIDRLVGRLASSVLVDSHSQKRFLVDQGVLAESAATVLGSGSISGVNLDKFRPLTRSKTSLKADLGVASDCVVILYLGRVCADKGIHDLVAAVLAVTGSNSNIHCLIVGPDEEGISEHYKNAMGGCCPSFTFWPYTERPEQIMSGADILVLPSYREGFGMAVIEAAACELACIGSDIYGLSDAIVDNETGLLFEVGNVPALVDRIERLVVDGSERERLGRNARARIKSEFQDSHLTLELIRYWKQKLGRPC